MQHNTETFPYMRGGLAAELDHLNLDEVLGHLRQLEEAFLLDDTLAAVYINRLVTDEGLADKDEALEAVRRLVSLHQRLVPFDSSGLALAAMLRPTPQTMARKRLVDESAAAPALVDKARNLMEQKRPERALELLRHHLRRHRSDMGAAAAMLNALPGRPEDLKEILALVACPEAAATDWLSQVHNHFSQRCAHDLAAQVFERMPLQALDATTLGFAAANYARLGEAERARNLYAVSLAKDPAQPPVARRLRELQDPTPHRPLLLEERRVSVCLYSWNKADLLERTLESLAASNLGRAAITVLDNGSTDHMQAVLLRARERFGDRPFHVVTMPVNVGAPAARNVLAAQPQSLAAEYVAYLDDDVTLPPDWLSRMLTVAESAPDVGVVGAKVLFPPEEGAAQRLQYLYRTFSVLREDCIRLSLQAPNHGLDNGLYDIVRETENVMGCCHVLSRAAMDAAPQFDLQFSPTQLDDVCHDIDLRLAGFRVLYCGLVGVTHHQKSGLNKRNIQDRRSMGNILGNDVKFYYRWVDRLEELRALVAGGRERAEMAA